MGRQSRPAGGASGADASATTPSGAASASTLPRSASARTSAMLGAAGVGDCNRNGGGVAEGDSEGSAPVTRFMALRSVVAVHANRFVVVAWDRTVGRWMLYGPPRPAELGPSFSSAMEKLARGRYQPTLLFYESVSRETAKQIFREYLARRLARRDDSLFPSLSPSETEVRAPQRPTRAVTHRAFSSSSVTRWALGCGATWGPGDGAGDPSQPEPTQSKPAGPAWGGLHPVQAERPCFP